MRLNFPVTDDERLYIEMCRKAKQIQESWKPKVGDFCVDMGDLWYIHNDEKAKYVESVKENDTWLPVEQQLQAMIIVPSTERPIETLSRLCEWSNLYRRYRNSLTKLPIKHLWLCYLMERNYGLMWQSSNCSEPRSGHVHSLDCFDWDRRNALKDWM